jgi:hypothetical protein
MCGADADTLLDAFRSRPSDVEPLTESWTRHFSALGEQEWAAGNTQLALTYLEIGFFSLPFLPVAEHQKAAYERHCQMYVTAGQSFDPPLEVVLQCLPGTRSPRPTPARRWTGGIGLFTGCAAGDTGVAVVIRVDGS